MHKKHGWMMILCFIPIIAVMVLFHSLDGGANWIWIMLLLCPAIHFFMMRDMHKGDCEKTPESSEKATEKN